MSTPGNSPIAACVTDENARLFRRLLWETPFDPTGRDWRTFKQAAGFLYRNWRIGGKLFRVLDMLSMSAYDFLSEWFSDERIKAVLAYYASIGTFDLGTWPFCTAALLRAAPDMGCAHFRGVRSSGIYPCVRDTLPGSFGPRFLPGG